MKRFTGRLRVIPFEIAVGLFAMYGGLATLLGVSVGVDNTPGLTLPFWLVTCVAISHGLGGLGVVIGVGTGRRDIEGAAVAILGTSLLGRGLAIILGGGLSGQTTIAIVFYLVTTAACCVRLLSLNHNDVVLKISNNGTQLGPHNDINEDQLHMRDKGGDDDDRV